MYFTLLCLHDLAFLHKKISNIHQSRLGSLRVLYQDFHVRSFRVVAESFQSSNYININVHNSLAWPKILSRLPEFADKVKVAE